MNQNEDKKSYVIYIPELDSYLHNPDSGDKFTADINKATIINGLERVKEFFDIYYIVIDFDFKVLSVEVQPNHLKDYYPDVKRMIDKEKSKYNSYSYGSNKSYINNNVSNYIEDISEKKIREQIDKIIEEK